MILTSASSRLTPNPTPATGRNFSHGNPGRATKRGAAHQNTTVVGPTSQPATPQNKPLRLRNRDHLKFVSAQACLALVGAGQMHTISGLRSSARLGAKSVMNSPCRFAGFTIVSPTGLAMNAYGGQHLNVDPMPMAQRLWRASQRGSPAPTSFAIPTHL